MKLSDGEKLIILMLTDMYKAMKVKGEFDPDFIATTIHGDHLWGFNWHYSGIPFEESPTPKEVTETADYLDMWWMLELAYQNLSAADRKRVEKEAEPFGNDVKFHGFDGNNEPHYGIANYLVNDLERFAHFKGRDLNSHSPSIEVYQRMYEVFEPLRKNLHNRDLNADEIITIMKAKLHPSRR
jgi:hypothetical protein